MPRYYHDIPGDFIGWITKMTIQDQRTWEDVLKIRDIVLAVNITNTWDVFSNIDYF